MRRPTCGGEDARRAPIGVVEDLADEVAVMRAGRIVEHGPAARVLCAPTEGYTRALLAAVPRIGALARPG